MRTNEEIMAELVKRRENCDKERGRGMKKAIIKTVSFVFAAVIAIGLFVVVNSNSETFVPASMADANIHLIENGLPLFESANIIRYAENMQLDELEEGVTVIYGSDIDVDAVEKQLFGIDKKELKRQRGKASADTVEPESDDTDVVPTVEIAYILMYYKYGDSVEREYVSSTYSADVDRAVIDKFIDYDTSDIAIKNYTKQFINKLVENGIIVDTEPLT